MFTHHQPLFIYAISPVHMGAGTALGLIDNPIAREVHSQHPVLAGSGLKGAIRHNLWAAQPVADKSDKDSKLNRYFGSESQADKPHAGAVSLSDAQLLLFPVRSARNGFVYATSPLALGRARRLLGDRVPWQLPRVEPGHCRLSAGDAGKCLIDVFEFEARVCEHTREIADWLAGHALPDSESYRFFADKLRQDLVVMSDDDFGFYVKNATSVEPHVRIDNDSGTAEKGGLFYTENLPPESLFIGFADDQRRAQ